MPEIYVNDFRAKLARRVNAGATSIELEGDDWQSALPDLGDGDFIRLTLEEGPASAPNRRERVLCTSRDEGVLTITPTTNGYAQGSKVQHRISAEMLSALQEGAARQSRLRLPPGFTTANVSTGRALPNGTTLGIYMGRADGSPDQISVRWHTTNAGANFNWAELAIATGTPVLNGDPELTRRGFESITADLDSLQDNTTEIDVEGISPGDDIWILIGADSSTNTPGGIRVGLGDPFESGFQVSAAVRPSTMADDTEFTVEAAAMTCMWAVLQEA